MPARPLVPNPRRKRPGDGMAWEGLCDRRPEQYGRRAQGGCSKHAEGVGATGSGAFSAALIAFGRPRSLSRAG
jgi:hypothetical protein